MAQQYIEQFVEVLTNVPDGANVNGILGGAALAAVGIIGAHEIFKHSKEEFAMPFPNPALLEVANQAVGGKSGEAARTNSIKALAVAGGFVAMHLLGSPNFEETEPVKDAAMVAVVDVSTSMVRTEDIGDKTRLEASISALKNSDYEGKLGVVIAAKGAKPVIPLTPASQWSSKLNSDKTFETISPNGGNIPEGIELASNLLPDKKGTILVISDGTIEQSPGELSGLVEKLSKQGTNLEFVVPGTKDGSYTFTVGGTPVEVGVNPDVFKTKGADNVSSVDTAGALEASVKQSIETATTEKHKRSWPGLLWAGGGFALYGFGRAANTLLRRRA